MAELLRRAPLLPGADVLAFIDDIDSQQRRVYGHAEQGAAFGIPRSRAGACWHAA
jgi:hypothetical protein